MTDFKPDCTINLHVEARGKPAKLAWSCSIVHAKRGRVVLARRFVGLVERDLAELEALEFGLAQAERFLQEKVELSATFGVEGHLGQSSSGRGRSPGLKLKREEVCRRWQAFRLRRVGRPAPDEAAALRESASTAYLRKR